MYEKYLITGASGFLGSTIIERLIASSAKIYALTLSGDRLADKLPKSVVKIDGDVCDIASLDEFFEEADESTCVIHCAGIVSVATNPGRRIYDVNVDGTKNMLSFSLERKVAKFVYVASVHAIPEQQKGQPIKEVGEFSPDIIYGDYSKSKAMAAQAVLDAAKQGLNACVVFPSSIIGPNDEEKGSVISMLAACAEGKLRVAVKGGYDFVDVRDVADGIVACTEKGEKGEGYILSGRFASIKEIVECAKDVAGVDKRVLYFPIFAAKAVAPLYERIAIRKKAKLFFTPYSIKVLSSNGRFSNEKAKTQLEFCPRPLAETIADTVMWLRSENPETPN